jgi:hypothetical protein
MSVLCIHSEQWLLAEHIEMVVKRMGFLRMETTGQRYEVQEPAVGPPHLLPRAPISRGRVPLLKFFPLCWATSHMCKADVFCVSSSCFPYYSGVCISACIA